MEQPSNARSGNKVRSYIFYAVGEIALVMIGILLALQVNNWNEERKKEEEVIRLISDYKKTTENIITNTEFHLSPFIQMDTVHYHILNKSLEPDLLNSSLTAELNLLIDPLYTDSFSGWTYSENVQTILENERLFPERFSRILFYVTRLNAAYQTMNTLQEEMSDLQSESQRYLRSKEWMHKDDPESYKERIEFFHTDTYFRNILRSFNELNGRYIQQEEIWVKYQLLAWIEYERLINEKKNDEIINQLESFGYKTAKEVDCNDTIVEDPFHSFYYWFPIFNNTSEPVETYFYNDFTKEKQLYDVVEPGAYSAMAVKRDFPFLQIGKDGNCERQYEVGWDGFVVIEP